MATLGTVVSTLLSQKRSSELNEERRQSFSRRKVYKKAVVLRTCGDYCFSGGIITEFVDELMDYPDCFDKECVVEILAQKSSPLPSSFNAGLSILDEDMFWLQQIREANFSPEPE